jgi:hypothetical protein
LKNPFLKKAWIIALHELETPTEVWLDPTLDVIQPFRQHAPTISESLIDWNHVVVLEALAYRPK